MTTTIWGMSHWLLYLFWVCVGVRPFMCVCAEPSCWTDGMLTMHQMIIVWNPRLAPSLHCFSSLLFPYLFPHLPLCYHCLCANLLHTVFPSKWFVLFFPIWGASYLIFLLLSGAHTLCGPLCVQSWGGMSNRCYIFEIFFSSKSERSFSVPVQSHGPSCRRNATSSLSKWLID